MILLQGFNQIPLILSLFLIPSLTLVLIGCCYHLVFKYLWRFSHKDLKWNKGHLLLLLLLHD